MNARIRLAPAATRRRSISVSAAAALLLTLPACERHLASAPAPAQAPAAPALQGVEKFPGDAAALPAGGHCSLDAVNGKPAADAVVAAGQPALFGGWMADDHGQVPVHAQLVLVGPGGKSYAAPLVAGAERPDVARVLGSPALVRSGFNLTAVLSVEPGTYDTFVVIGEESPVACAFKVRVRVAP